MTSILTPYVESAGLLAPGVKISSNSVEQLQSNYSIQTHSKLSMENLNLGNPSHPMTKRSHTPTSHNAKNGFFISFPQGAH